MNKEPFVLNLPWALQIRLVVLPVAKRCELEESHGDLVLTLSKCLEVNMEIFLVVIKSWELHLMDEAREKKDLAQAECAVPCNKKQCA